MIYNINKGTELLRIKIDLIDLKAEALVDSGAARSLIREDIYRQIRVADSIQPLEEIRLFDVQQRELNTLGVIHLSFRYCNRMFIHEFIVTDAIREEVILGLDIIIKHKLNIEGTGNEAIVTQNGGETDRNETINVTEEAGIKVNAPHGPSSSKIPDTVNEGVHAPHTSPSKVKSTRQEWVYAPHPSPSKVKSTSQEWVNAPHNPSPSKIQSAVYEGVHAPPSQIISTIYEGVNAPPSRIQSTVCEGVHAPPNKIQSAVYEGVHAPPSQIFRTNHEGVDAPPSRIQSTFYEGVHASPSQIQRAVYERVSAPLNKENSSSNVINNVTFQVEVGDQDSNQINQIGSVVKKESKQTIDDEIQDEEVLSLQLSENKIIKKKLELVKVVQDNVPIVEISIKDDLQTMYPPLSDSKRPRVREIKLKEIKNIGLTLFPLEGQYEGPVEISNIFAKDFSQTEKVEWKEDEREKEERKEEGKEKKASRLPTSTDGRGKKKGLPAVKRLNCSLADTRPTQKGEGGLGDQETADISNDLANKFFRSEKIEWKENEEEGKGERKEREDEERGRRMTRSSTGTNDKGKEEGLQAVVELDYPPAGTRPTKKEEGETPLITKFGVEIKPIQGTNRYWFFNTDNLEPEKIISQLKSNESIATVNHVSDHVEISAENLNDTETLKKEGGKLLEIINRFKGIIATSNFDLGSTDIIKHTIDVQGNPPIRLRAYRPPFKQKEEIDRQVQEMLDHGIIRPSKSPWAAPVVLVKKKSGEMRFCINYRQLNNATKKDSYPLPRIDDILDKMSGKTIFSTLDLASGYFQIVMDDASKELTAFIVENNLYEFNRMPFGLTNAPSTFQRLMNFVLRDTLQKFALVYLDDIIIFSNDRDNHYHHIETIFKLLHDAGLKLKLKKCHFLKESVEYLGHIISKEGIAPDPGKIDKIANYKVPQNSEELASFLGLTGYYRPFIKDYGTIAKPLSCQTKKSKKEPLIWGEIEQKAFEILRIRLTTSPILAYPDFTAQFQIFTDASNYGIGAILSQTQNGQEVVISYRSRHLKPSELKYATIEKEALAVVFGIKQFKHYLIDSEFLVISDHRPLQWLENIKDENGRLGRWAVQLANMKYKIKYKPGRVHQNADCLSRIQMLQIVHASDSELSITRAQASDPLCQDINNLLDEGQLSQENKDKPPVWAKEIQLFNNTNGILTRDFWPTSQRRRKEMRNQIVLPLSLRPLILQEYHDKPASGHLAFHRTFLKVQDKYYWPNMITDIKEYCKACVKCATTSKKVQPRAPLHPLQIADAPFAVLAIDFLGPMTPSSRQGNSFIMVVTDYLTKWVEAIPVSDQTADTTSKALVKHIIARHGPPKAILTDKGSNFTSLLFTNICVYLGIKRKLTTAYHPQTDGQTERFNRTLMGMLRNYVEKTHDDWERVLELLCFAYRASVHSSTHESPYYLMHGRDHAN